MNATGAGEPERTWRVGELAEQTGLTVRALHHYHEIGLLVPSLLNGAGHRRYTEADVRRLHRILALRGFGFALAEIGVLLDGTPIDPRVLIQRQLDQVDVRIRESQRLRDRLLRVRDALDTQVEPSGRKMIELIEGMTAMQQRLTPEQFAAMKAEREAFLESLSAQQLAELNERRREAAERLSPEELDEMRRKRATLLPPEAG